MKKWLGALALSAILIFATSGAASGFCLPWEDCGGDEEEQEMNITNNNNPEIDIENNNKAYGGDAEVNIGGGLFSKTLSPEANADVDVSNKNYNTNKNDNTNMNFNTNKNTNIGINDNTNVNKNTNVGINKNDNRDTNINLNGQGQEQGQKQGQKQGQIQDQDQKQNQKQNMKQSQDASNKQGQAQSTDITIEDNRVTTVEDQYNHIQTPDLLKAAAELAKSKASSIKTKGWDIIEGMDYITLDEARMLGKDADDFEIKMAIFFDVGYESQGIHQLKPGQTPPGKRQGKVYLIPEGEDVNAAGGVGRVLEAAMEVGATHFRIAEKDNEGEFVTGDAWNIGLSGGASLMADGGDKMIAPGGGLGVGEAESTTEKRPAGMIEIWFDESVVSERYTTLF